MKNLRVCGRPAEIFKSGSLSVPLRASVNLEVYSDSGADIAYSTSTLVLDPAQARQLAAELLAAAAIAEPPAGGTGIHVNGAAGGTQEATDADPTVTPAEGPCRDEAKGNEPPQIRSLSTADDAANSPGGGAP